MTSSFSLAQLPTLAAHHRVSRPGDLNNFWISGSEPHRILGIYPGWKRRVPSEGFTQASLLCATQPVRVNLYEVLGVSLGSSDEEMKDAYRSMVKQYHPDHAPPEKAEEYQKKFMEVHRAYQILKDPKRRSIYEFEIRNSTQNWRNRKKEGQWCGKNWETDQCWTS